MTKEGHSCPKCDEKFIKEKKESESDDSKENC
jgi:hypothetical protein